MTAAVVNEHLLTAHFWDHNQQQVLYLHPLFVPSFHDPQMHINLSTKLHQPNGLLTVSIQAECILFAPELDTKGLVHQILRFSKINDPV